MDKQRSCPACGKVLEDKEVHLAKPFEVKHPVPQMPRKRFWVCNETIEGLEKLVNMYRITGLDGLINVP